MFSTKLSNIVRISQHLRPNRVCNKAVLAAGQTQQTRQKNDLYEPDYLISMEPEEPVYECLNIQLKGYDYALLEACQRQVHRYARVMGVAVEECWAAPAAQLRVQRYKPRGTALDAEYSLCVYERTVQLLDVPAWALGTLLRVVRALLPEGCAARVLEHSAALEEARYVPDNQLRELQTQLSDMGGPRADRARRR